MSKFNVGTMTVDGAAKWLRQAAEMTASASKNWDNFETICKEMLTSAYEGGKTENNPEESSET